MDSSKAVQKEIKAVERARKSAKIERILAEFRNLKRIEKTRTRKSRDLIGSVIAEDGDVKDDRQEIA